MDYEKAYKEALERAKDCLADGTITSTAEKYIEAIFPELKENEDEKIRKAIHIYLDWLDGRKDYEPKGKYTIKDMIAWLEKQMPSDAALEYLKENHSPSEVSDFQAAMNIAVAKAYDRGRGDAIAEMHKQDPCHTCDHPTMSCNDFPCEKKQAEQKTADKVEPKFHEG
jgi:hypothetical protein